MDYQLKGVRRTVKKLILALGLVALLTFAAGASAHGGKPITFTERMHNVTDTFADVNPCTGDPTTVTIVNNGVLHVTEFADGHVHVTGTFTGTVAIDTTDPSKPDYSGRFTQWFGENRNVNTENGTFTFSVRARGTDGSRLQFHETAHFLAVGGDLQVEFDKMRCG
jgi:hypothetical protein